MSIKIKKINDRLSVATQLSLDEIEALKAQGFKTIINNRHDDEEITQPKSETLAKRAKALGLAYFYLPVNSTSITDQDVESFDKLVETQIGPILAFCRTGTRCATLWALSEADNATPDSIISRAKDAGYDLEALGPRILERRGMARANPIATHHHDIVIIGGGAGGIATAASLMKRNATLDIAIIEPSQINYYQPGWTLVGGGIFAARKTAKKTQDVLPKRTQWIQSRVTRFEPKSNCVLLEDGQEIRYNALVVAAGIQLDVDAIDGLAQTLGKNGVTTNYQFHLAPYTWRLIRKLRGGTAIFTQPPMPIKCAGAPQKIMYLAADYWRKHRRLETTSVHFCSAGAGIFGVAQYVPTLLKYVKKYNIDLNFEETLVAVDGPSRTAWFDRNTQDGKPRRISRKFDLLHVTPPQSAPDFIKKSALANAEGWVDVDPKTLRHLRYKNIYAVGDCGSMPNAKTMAAARKQAPVVAVNLLAGLEGRGEYAHYDGYGSCPLTVERGKIALTEFGYDGVLLPTFPKWFIDGTKASRLAWWLKVKIMPSVYWKLMLKGREWLAKPTLITDKSPDL